MDTDIVYTCMDNIFPTYSNGEKLEEKGTGAVGTLMSNIKGVLKPNMETNLKKG